MKKLYVVTKNVIAESAWKKYKDNENTNIRDIKEFKKIFKMGFKAGYKTRKFHNILGVCFNGKHKR